MWYQQIKLEITFALSSVSFSPVTRFVPPSASICDFVRGSAVYSNNLLSLLIKFQLGKFCQWVEASPHIVCMWRSVPHHWKHINTHTQNFNVNVYPYRTTYNTENMRQSISVNFFSLNLTIVSTKCAYIAYTQATMHLIRTFYPSLCLICTTMQIHMKCVCTHCTVVCLCSIILTEKHCIIGPVSQWETYWEFGIKRRKKKIQTTRLFLNKNNHDFPSKQHTYTPRETHTLC